MTPDVALQNLDAQIADATARRQQILARQAATEREVAALAVTDQQRQAAQAQTAHRAELQPAYDEILADARRGAATINADIANFMAEIALAFSLLTHVNGWQSTILHQIDALAMATARQAVGYSELFDSPDQLASHVSGALTQALTNHLTPNPDHPLTAQLRVLLGWHTVSVTDPRTGRSRVDQVVGRALGMR